MPAILIVDDKSENLKAYKLTLEDCGTFTEIHTATNEDEACKIIDEVQLDIILTDLIMLDEKSGMKVLKKAIDKDPLIMVLLITAYDAKLERYEAFKRGAFDCITKSAPGIKTADELIVKTKTALNFRMLALDQIKNNSEIQIFKRYFDPNVFEQLRQNPEILNLKDRTITIVFWDIRGFSKLCETLKAHPELIAGFLKEYFEVAANFIFKNNGVLDKFIGDGVMALFGALDDKGDEGTMDAVNAATAAMNFKKEFTIVLKNWMKEWAKYTAESIEIGLGCGIHTGSSLVGNVGTEARDDFTALGPNVNLASRIESRSGKEEILVSKTTATRISSRFNLKKAFEIDDIKNIPGKYEVYKITGFKKVSHY